MGNDRFQQALDYIYSFIDYETQPKPRDPVNYDLRRMDELLARLGNPHLNTSTVHVAGSKGKGSVSAMITSVLATAGYKTGLYTSPHLHIFNERIRVNDRLISDDEIIDLVDKIKPEVKKVNDKATYGKLTTFEIITALGFMHFRDAGIEVQIIEPGLGGRLDATNVVRPKVCVITSISLEHTDVLGNTLAEIAREKAGIIKPGGVVVSSPQVDEVMNVIEQACQTSNSPLIKVGKDITWQDLEFDSFRQSFVLNGRRGSYKVSIPLLGQYQVENAAAAVTAVELLVDRGFSVSEDDISRGLAEVDWPGRLQVLNRRPLVVVDGAHNPYSTRLLKESIERYFDFEKGVLIFGASDDKDIAGMAGELVPMFNKVIITRSIHPRAMSVKKIVTEFERYGVETKVTEDISDALPLALDMAGEQDIICVTGSLFVVAGAIEQAEELGFTA